MMALADWQPIETAPKDGSLVVLTNGVGPSNIGWYPFVGRWSDELGKFGMALTDTRTAPVSGTPTHWVPFNRSPSHE